MTKIYGYARISTAKQSIERQIRNIQSAYPEAIIVTEQYTGTKISGRVQFEKLLKVVKRGDTLVFDSVSRMSRNAEEGFALYQKLFSEGVELCFIKEPYINTSTFRQTLESNVPLTGTDADLILQGVNAYLMRLAERQIQIAFEQSEKEVADLHERTREGIITAKLNGKQIGRAEGARIVTKKAVAAKEIIRKHSKDFCGTLNDADCMKLIGCARNSFYKYKNELRNEQ